MTSHLSTLLNQPLERRRLRNHGLKTIRSRHTCSHRVDELFSLLPALQAVGVLQGNG
jgi:spore maturation protein CgeB